MELEKYFDLLEAYREGRLDPAEKEAFEKKLRTDNRLHHAWTLYRFSLSALELQKDARIRETVNKVRREEKRTRTLRRRLLLAVAIIALLAAGAGGWWHACTRYSDEALYNGFYALPPQLKSPQTAEILEAIAPDQPGYENARFVLAQIYLQSGRNEEAIPYISPLTESLDSTLAAQSEWYLALALLQSGKTAECREWLRKIASDSAHPYYRKAGKLEKKLKSIWRITYFTSPISCP